MSDTPRAIGLIPARAGSKRVPGKNTRPLAGHPLIAYSICSALDSGVFDTVIVSTDSEETAEISRHYGAEVPFLRPDRFATDTSPDFEWLDHLLHWLSDNGRPYDCFSILRPTSPFRTSETIQRAWQQFSGLRGVDSLRAVEKCGQHPGKMWVIRGEYMTPVLPYVNNLNGLIQPWHSCQYPSLPEVYVQNASLEIAWSRVIFNDRNISGSVLTPFLTTDIEGFDINQPIDWRVAEELVAAGEAKLPPINRPA